MKVLTVVGTRPELIRLSLVFDSFIRFEIEHVLVHTGQNYDARLSQIFIDELGIPDPDVYLGIRAERIGEQIGQIIARRGGAARAPAGRPADPRRHELGSGGDRGGAP
jgi:UDP-N-acetylglucosamine 2-epimerase